MNWLVLVHVLSAIIGVGPTFFGHSLLRSNQSVSELRHSMRLSKTLNTFPKVGGPLAVLSGLALVWLGEYGSFMQLWIVGSLALFIIIEVIVIGFVAPASQKLAMWLLHPDNRDAESLPTEQRAQFERARKLLWSATVLGILLFAFMIMKPAIVLWV